MKPKFWKTGVVLLSVGIILAFEFAGAFHSLETTYNTYPVNGNGSVIIVSAISGASVNGKIQITDTAPNATSGPVTVTFPNGTTITVYQATLKFHFNGTFFNVNGGSMGPGNISVSNQHPLDSAILHNASLDYYSNKLPGMLKSSSLVHYYTIYVQNYSQVKISVVGVE